MTIDSSNLKPEEKVESETKSSNEASLNNNEHKNTTSTKNQSNTQKDDDQNGINNRALSKINDEKTNTPNLDSKVTTSKPIKAEVNNQEDITSNHDSSVLPNLKELNKENNQSKDSKLNDTREEAVQDKDSNSSNEEALDKNSGSSLRKYLNENNDQNSDEEQVYKLKDNRIIDLLKENTLNDKLFEYLFTEDNFEKIYEHIKLFSCFLCSNNPSYKYNSLYLVKQYDRFVDFIKCVHRIYDYLKNLISALREDNYYILIDGEDDIRFEVSDFLICDLAGNIELRQNFKTENINQKNYNNLILKIYKGYKLILIDRLGTYEIYIAYDFYHKLEDLGIIARLIEKYSNR